MCVCFDQVVHDRLFAKGVPPRCCKLNCMLSDNFSVSGVARVLRAHVQRHVMGPLVTKQLSISFAARAGRTVASSQFT